MPHQVDTVILKTLKEPYSVLVAPYFTWNDRCFTNSNSQSVEIPFELEVFRRQFYAKRYLRQSKAAISLGKYMMSSMF